MSPVRSIGRRPREQKILRARSRIGYLAALCEERLGMAIKYRPFAREKTTVIELHNARF